MCNLCVCGASLCACVYTVAYASLGVHVLFVICSHCSKRNANYWASGSVKCTAVVTVSARWTIELVYNLTVGGVSRSHPKNHPVALASSANVNQQVAFKAQGNIAIAVFLYRNPFPPFTVRQNIVWNVTVLTSTEFKVSASQNKPLSVKDRSVRMSLILNLFKH